MVWHWGWFLTAGFTATFSVLRWDCHDGLLPGYSGWQRRNKNNLWKERKEKSVLPFPRFNCFERRLVVWCECSRYICRGLIIVSTVCQKKNVSSKLHNICSGKTKANLINCVCAHRGEGRAIVNGLVTRISGGLHKCLRLLQVWVPWIYYHTENLSVSLFTQLLHHILTTMGQTLDLFNATVCFGHTWDLSVLQFVWVKLGIFPH